MVSDKDFELFGAAAELVTALTYLTLRLNLLAITIL